ncbi:MAG: pirin family protein [Candidatus Berkiella sp.]
MISLRKSADRGLTEIDWLKSYHTFSFGDYYDPQYMGFGTLRVINQDTVQPSQGFGTHQHRDMEIISYVIEGALEHKDSMGTGSVIKPGEIQRMSAGTGVAHSEFNASKDELVHFLQIWILPTRAGLTPSYEQKKLPQGKQNELVLIGSPEGGEYAITIHQDAYLYVAHLVGHKSVNYLFKPERKGWLQLIKGVVTANGQRLEQGDGAAITDTPSLTIESVSNAEFLLFDLK